MKLFITIVVTVIVTAIVSITAYEYLKPPDLIQLEGNRQWCYYDNFQSMEQYDLEREATVSFIDPVGARDEIRVFVPCRALESGIIEFEL